LSTPSANDFDNARHAAWEKFQRRWEMAFDFWRGGVHVLEPDHPAGVGLFATELPDAQGQGGVRPQDAPRQARYEWRAAEVNSYIYKHQRETLPEFEDRCRRAINLPLFQYAVNTLAAGTLRDWPVRDGTDPKWEQIHADMDLLGTDADAFFRRALSLALVFGRVHACCDMVLPDRPAVSLGEQIARGERPYVHLVTPLELVDWDVDHYGRFKWAVLVEDSPSERHPGQVPKKGDAPGPQYRVWYPNGWELYRRPALAGPEKYVRVDGDSHDLGEVPIYTLFCTRLAQAGDMACETPLPDMLDLNRHLLNDLSELDDTDRSQAFAILGVPVADGLGAASIDIGPKRGLAYSAEAGAPAYISADAAQAAGRWLRLTEKAFLGRQLGGLSRGKAEHSKEERSAAAIAAEAEDKKNQLAWWSRALQEFDLQVHRGLAAWMGEDDYPRAAYSTNFETKGTMSAVQELVQLSAVPIMADAREALAALTAPLLRKLLLEHGADDKTIATALASIDEAGKKKPEPPPAPGGFGAPRGQPSPMTKP
jgi:hypothetical protein